MSDKEKKPKIKIHGMGASNHTLYERAKNDFYSTDPLAVQMLHKHDLLDKNLPYWETAVGKGAISNELRRLGYKVTKETDLIDYGVGDTGQDFFSINEKFEGNTITNPPYKNINDWILHSLELTTDKVYIFCRIQTLESMNRYEKIFKNNPPKYVCPFVKRVNCYREDDHSFEKKASTICYSWFIWDNKEHTEDPIIKWLI